MEARERALRDIRIAWVAALVSAALTGAMVLLAAYLDVPVIGFSLFSAINVVVLLAGAYGVWQRSRTAAVLLLVFFVVSQVSVRLQYPEVGYSGIVVTAIFATLYLRGAVATFKLHRLESEERETVSPRALPVGAATE